MALAALDRLRCYYRLEGAADLPALVLCHSLGLDHGMWDSQLPALLPRFRVLRYDLRGHGATDAPAGDYAVEDLARDVLSLLDRLGLERVAWCGVSLGGLVGQWLAVYAPERLTALVLANTTARVADPGSLDARRRIVLDQGMRGVVETVMGRFFTAATIDANPPRIASARETLLSTSPAGYAGCCAAVRDFDGRSVLGRIRTRTLVIGGDRDESMPWPDHGAVLAREIPGAAAVRLATAHLSNLELPRTFSRVLVEFLAPDTRDALAQGLDVRKAVLGEDHVARNLASATELTRAFQETITRYAWGGIWTRPGLDHHTRRLLVLATTAALGRWEEYRLHLEAGLDRDLEWADVEEVLLQTAVYAGVPAANTGFAIAAECRLRRNAQ